MLHVLGFQAASRLARPLAMAVGGLIVLALSGTAVPGRSGAASAHGGAPLAAAVVTQGFGCTWVSFEPYDAACASRHFHSGIDLADPQGTPVYSVTAGITSVVASAGGYGLHVTVQGGDVLVLYGHLSAVAVRSSALVAPGQLLGWVGSTGNSTGPHLHFEVRRAGVPVDPSPWLPAYGTTPRQGGDQRWSTKSS